MNSWLPRDTSPILDAIYRRAADLMRIDEALLRRRGEDEFPDWPTKQSIAESLQLVHYDPGQKYTPHHGKKCSGSALSNLCCMSLRRHQSLFCWSPDFGASVSFTNTK